MCAPEFTQVIELSLNVKSVTVVCDGCTPAHAGSVLVYVWPVKVKIVCPDPPIVVNETSGP